MRSSAIRRRWRFSESLTDEQAAKQPLLILEYDGVVARYWREGGRVRCCEIAAEASIGSSSEMEAVHAAAEFGRSLPHLKAELRVGGVSDLGALETLVRAGMLSCGAQGYTVLLEGVTNWQFKPLEIMKDLLANFR